MGMGRGAIVAAGLIWCGALQAAPRPDYSVTDANAPPGVVGLPHAGLRVSVKVQGKLTVGGKLVVILTVRNISRRPVDMPPKNILAGWVQIWQRGGEGRILHIGRKLHPARRASGYPKTLGPGRTYTFPSFRLTNSPAFPASVRRTVLGHYLYGRDESVMPPTRAKLTEVIFPGKLYLQAWLHYLKPPATRFLAPDVTALPVSDVAMESLSPARQKVVIDEIIRQFNSVSGIQSVARERAITHGKAVVPALLAAVKKGKSPHQTRLCQVVTLLSIPDERSADLMIDLLKDPSRTMRYAVAYYGPRLRSAKLDSRIIAQAWLRKDDHLTAQVVLGFLIFRGEDHGYLLRTGDEKVDQQLRVALATVTAARASDARVEDLLPRMKHKDQNVRAAAAQALRTMRRLLPRVYPALIQALDLPGEGAREAICRSLAEMTNHRVRYDPAADESTRRQTLEFWKQWWSREEKKARPPRPAESGNP